MNKILLLSALLFVGACASKTIKTTINEANTQVFYNGDIITMEGNTPQYAEGLVVKNGKISFVGSKAEAMRQAGAGHSMIDLKGKTLLPGFVDPHSHIFNYANFLEQGNLFAAPVGKIKNISDIVEEMKGLKMRKKFDDTTLLIGYGYDQSLLSENRHPTAADLDAAFPTNPVLLMHVSGHMVVANSVALKMINYTSSTKDPEGGAIKRKTGSQDPEGLVQEFAMLPFMRYVYAPKPMAHRIELLMEAQKYYASCGVTTVQEGAAPLNYVETALYAAAHNNLYLDMVVLPNAKFYNTEQKMKTLPWAKTYDNHLRFGGLKLIGDGSPQGKTAFLSKPYLTEVDGCAHDCRGFSNLNQAEMDSLVYISYKNGIQVYIHSNGDATTDMMLEAHKTAILKLNEPQKDRRTTIIHSQIMRPDQLDAYKANGFIASFFTNHTFYWGDVHLENLGNDRANFISPIRSAMDKGIVCTNHTDLIVTPLDQMFLLWTSVNRISRKGKVIGENQKITPYEGLKALTINGAYQYFEENNKGSLKAGKVADFVILDKNPLKVPILDIKSIRILQTIKDGKTVFQKE